MSGKSDEYAALFPIKKKAGSKIEDRLFEEMKLYGLPLPVRQFMFHPSRKFRFDFCWPDLMLALEVQGGIFLSGAKAGGHNRGYSMEADFTKFNEAQRLGWRCFLFGPSQCRGKKRTQTPSEALAFIHHCLKPGALRPPPAILAPDTF